MEEGWIELVEGFQIEEVRKDGDGLEVVGRGGNGRCVVQADRIVRATGFRPDHSLARELRLSLDPGLESASGIAPLIDPNVHTCDTVPPHGAQELAHPERGYYAVGMKSYGRAPTFLLSTGYGQVRSVVADLLGSRKTAKEEALSAYGVNATCVEVGSVTGSCCSVGGPVIPLTRKSTVR